MHVLLHIDYLYIYMRNAYTHTYTFSLDRDMDFFFFLRDELYFILDSKNIFLTYSLPTADNKSAILKVIEDDSFSAVIIKCFL